MVLPGTMWIMSLSSGPAAALTNVVAAPMNTPLSAAVSVRDTCVAADSPGGSGCCWHRRAMVGSLRRGR